MIDVEHIALFLSSALPEVIGISPILLNSFNFSKSLHMFYLSISLWLTFAQCSTDSGLFFSFSPFIISLSTPTTLPGFPLLPRSIPPLDITFPCS